MTEDQVAKWQARRDEAKKIADPVAREKALDMVYDLKDDMLLDCQRKVGDRIKLLVENDKEQRQEIRGIKDALQEMKTDLEQQAAELRTDHTIIIEDHELINEFKEHKLRAAGFMMALKVLGYVAAAGGGVAVKWALDAVNQINGM